MVLWNHLEGGPSRSGPLLGPSESIRGGTPCTNPCQQPQTTITTSINVTSVINVQFLIMLTFIKQV
jgi:hypothetical protein